MRAPITSVYILQKPLIPILIYSGHIKHGCSRPISMCELSLQPLDVMDKSWMD